MSREVSTEHIVLTLAHCVIIISILGSESFTRWLILSASTSTRDSARELWKTARCLHPHHLRVHKFQNRFYQLVGIECPCHLSLPKPLKLHSFSGKKTISRCTPPPTILGYKAKSNHQGDSNEPQIILFSKSKHLGSR